MSWRTVILSCAVLASSVICRSVTAEDTPDASDVLLIGNGDRSGKASIELSQELFREFAQDTGRKVRFEVMPLARMHRDFEEGELDIFLFMDDVIRSSYMIPETPFAQITLYAITRKGRFEPGELDVRSHVHVGAMIRGDNLEGTIDAWHRFELVEDTGHAVRVVLAGRVDYALEWDTEFFQRYTIQDLEDMSLELHPVILDVPIYPVMRRSPKAEALLEEWNDWFLARHKNGTLRPVFEKYRLGGAYPWPWQVDPFAQAE